MIRNLTLKEQIEFFESKVMMIKQKLFNGQYENALDIKEMNDRLAVYNMELRELRLQLKKENDQTLGEFKHDDNEPKVDLDPYY